MRPRILAPTALLEVVKIQIAIWVQGSLVESTAAVADGRHVYHLEVHDRWRCRKAVLVAIQMLFVAARQTPGLSLAVVALSGRGRYLDSWRDLDDRILGLRQVSKCFWRATVTASDVVLHSVTRVATMRSCIGCKSSPASSPTRSANALEGSGVHGVLVVTAEVGVVVRALSICGAPSASASTARGRRAPLPEGAGAS